MTELGSDEFWTRIAQDPARLAAEICFVDVANLDTTLQRHAGLRAWVNAAHEVARTDEERAKWELTKARALAYQKARADLDPISGKAKTVQALEAEVDLAESVQAATERLLTTQAKRGSLRAMADALEDRKDMLIQIAAKNRQEIRDTH